MMDVEERVEREEEDYRANKYNIPLLLKEIYKILFFKSLLAL